MQVIITDTHSARSRVLRVSGVQLVLALLLLAAALLLTSAAAYHWIVLKGVREGWPVLRSVAGLVERDDAVQRERYLRANIDAMARKLGEVQARVVQLESVGQRVMGLAGMPPLQTKTPPGSGGALVQERALSLQELDAALDDLTALADRRVDMWTAAELRLLDQHVRSHLIPTQLPVASGALSSSFGVRIDPLTGRAAQHTGLDFPASTGTTIVAAAGGVVVTQEWHREYGNMIEIDHGNQIITRYAHASRVLVQQGDLVRRGQKIAEVGSTGRSTGPHLHFEVWVRGMYQNPGKFLFAGQQPVQAVAGADGSNSAGQGAPAQQ